MTTFKAGLIGLVVILVFTYFGFTKFANPFASPYTVDLVVANTSQLRPSSQVRVAGVNVGQVSSVVPYPDCMPKPCSEAKVTMTVQSMGLPIHKDATFAIRPRLFLEGNFFVDIHPGSPSAPIAPSGYTFPMQATQAPVQFDQILTSLQADTRANLQALVQQYGSAVKQAGPSYNKSIQYWLPAYKYTAMVNHDLLGLQPHDLSTWIDKGGVVAGAVDANPTALKNLVSDFDTTALAFARQQGNLQKAVRELPTTLGVAIPAFTSLNRIICAGGVIKPGCGPGVVPQLASALIPGVKSTLPMIHASLPFFEQLRLLVQPSELQGLAKALTYLIPSLTRLTEETIPFMKNEVRPASACVVDDIYPWTQLSIRDKHFNRSNGFPSRKVYVEAVDYLPGLAGESRNFDSIGPFIRVAESAGGTLTYSLGNANIPAQKVFGQAVAPLVGAEPTKPPNGKRPPLAGGDIPNYHCDTQPAITEAELNSAGDTAAPKNTATPTSTTGLPPVTKLPIPPLAKP